MARLPGIAGQNIKSWGIGSGSHVYADLNSGRNQQTSNRSIHQTQAPRLNQVLGNSCRPSANADISPDTKAIWQPTHTLKLIYHRHADRTGECPPQMMLTRDLM
jgi:hypothetical protein